MNNISVCTKCSLHKTATNVMVLGKGSDEPTIMFVGIAPGWQENASGECFVGKAGKKLMSMLSDANLNTDICRFTNLVRCIPWKSAATKDKVRDPVDDEIAACSNYLLKEITLYDPTIIVPLGKIPASFFLPHLAANLKITKVSGVTFNWSHPTTSKEYTVIPTLHPAAICRSDHWLPKVMEALSTIKNIASGKTPADIFAECEYEYLDTLEKIENYVNSVIARYEADPNDPYNVVSIDVETGFKDPIPEDYDIPRETILLHPYNPYHTLVSLQLCHEPKKGALIPFWHKDSPFKDYVIICKIAEHLQRLVDVVPVIGQNFKFDYQDLYVMLGVRVKKFLFDSMLAHFLVFQKSKPLNLEYLAGMYVDMPFFKQEMSKALESLPPEIRHMGYVDLDKLVRYGCGDADAVFRLYKYWRPELEEYDLWDVYQDILRDATVSFGQVEINGMVIDPARLEKLKVDYVKELTALLKKIRSSAYVKKLDEIRLDEYWEKEEARYAKENAKREEEGRPPIKRRKWTPEQQLERENKVKQKLRFKPSSGDQLRLLFYDDRLMDFSIKDKGKTKKGNVSADKNARTKILEDAHSELKAIKDSKQDDEESVDALEECIWVVDSINDWVGKNKLYTAYVKGANELIHDKGNVKRLWPIQLPDEVHPWSFHSNFKIHGADTGRTSCEGPNLQQMPYKSLIKWMFISRWKNRGGVLFQADFSQAELRVLAKLCNELAMLDAFNRGEDIHMFVAGLVFGALGIPKEKIDKRMRRIAKTASFGIVYGQGPKALAYSFGTSEAEAREIIKTMFKVFPNLRGWMDAKVEECKKEGLVTTPMGRIRWIQGATSTDDFTAAEAARKAVNTPIQSAASDWTVCALNEVVKRIREREMRSLIVATIHDSIMADVYPGELFDVMDIMQQEMVTRLPERFEWIRGVTPKIDFEFGVDWKAMTDIARQIDLTYKIKGYPQDIKKNLKQLTLCGNVEQLDAYVDIQVDNDGNESITEDSWVLADIDF